MNYQNIACWGDSQTFGARTYGCYPLYLVRRLNRDTQYKWRAFNYSTNGHCVRDLWFRLSRELPPLVDVYQACLMIGTNDVGRNIPIGLFEEYYRQAIDALLIAGFQGIYCGEIPPIYPGGNSFFSSDTDTRRDKYNEAIESVAASHHAIRLVRFENMTKECYCDPVHFTELGNQRIAEGFARAIITF